MLFLLTGVFTGGAPTRDGVLLWRGKSPHNLCYYFTHIWSPAGIESGLERDVLSWGVKFLFGTGCTGLLSSESKYLYRVVFWVFFFLGCLCMCWHIAWYNVLQNVKNFECLFYSRRKLMLWFRFEEEMPESARPSRWSSSLNDKAPSTILFIHDWMMVF